MLRQLEYVDSKGFKWKVLVPDDAPDSHAQFGVVIGPPQLDELELPIDMHRRLHNELYSRHLFGVKDALARRGDITAAIMFAFKVDTERLVEIYMKESGLDA